MSIKDRRRVEAAQGYLMLEMPDHALKSLDEVQNLQDFRFEIDKQCGEAFRQKENYSEALKAYERIDLNENPDLEVMIGIAWCYKRTNRLHLSITTMEKAYESFPNVPIVLYNLACYYALAGDKKQALSWLGRSIRMESSLRQLVTHEPDFNSLRNDPEFQFITSRTQEK